MDNLSFLINFDAIENYEVLSYTWLDAYSFSLLSFESPLLCFFNNASSVHKLD